MSHEKRPYRPYAQDWEEIRDGVFYSRYLQRYWANNRVYDERSARHNGIIGAGAELRDVIAEINNAR